MKTVKTWNKKSAADIIVGRDGTTNGDDNMTGDIIWYFATNTLPDGTIDDQGPCKCDVESAEVVVITSSRGNLAQLKI